MAYRVVLTLALLTTTRFALANPQVANTGPSVQWEAPDACPQADLLRQVRGLVGLDQGQLATKLVRLVAKISPRPEGDWHAQLAIQTSAGAGDRVFDAEDCRSLRNGIALIVALAIDPAVPLPATSTGQGFKPMPVEDKTGPAGPGAVPRPLFVVRPLLGVDVHVLPEAGLTYGLAVGLAWPHVRFEVDGKSVSGQEAYNPAGHGGRIGIPLGFGGRGCLQSAATRPAELAACAGATMDWLRSTGVGIANPETRDSFAFGFTVGGALGLRLRDWLWLRVEGSVALFAKRPRFLVDNREEVYRVPVLGGFVGGGIEFRL